MQRVSSVLFLIAFGGSQAVASSIISIDGPPAQTPSIVTVPLAVATPSIVVLGTPVPDDGRQEASAIDAAPQSRSIMQAPMMIRDGEHALPAGTATQ